MLTHLYLALVTFVRVFRCLTINKPERWGSLCSLLVGEVGRGGCACAVCVGSSLWIGQGDFTALQGLSVAPPAFIWPAAHWHRGATGFTCLPLRCSEEGAGCRRSPGTKQKPGTSWMQPCILAPPCTWHNWQSVREELELGLGWTRGGRLWLVVSGSPFPALPFLSVSTSKGQCTTSSFAANPLCFMANTQSDFFFLGLSWAFFGPASYFFFNMYCIIDSSKFLYFIA